METRADLAVPLGKALKRGLKGQARYQPLGPLLALALEEGTPPRPVVRVCAIRGHFTLARPTSAAASVAIFSLD